MGGWLWSGRWQGFHSNLWGLKYLIFIGSVFGMFFVENGA